MHLAALRRAGAQRHRPAACGAVGQPGQQDRASDDTRRQNARIAGGKARLSLVEDVPLDDRRHRDLNDFVFGFSPASLGLAPVETPAPCVNWVGQDLVDRADAITCAKASSLPARVDCLCDLLGAHRPTNAVALKVKPVNEPHRLGLDGIDNQSLLGPVPALFDLGQRIAKRQAGPVILFSP